MDCRLSHGRLQTFTHLPLLLGRYLLVRCLGRRQLTGAAFSQLIQRGQMRLRFLACQHQCRLLRRRCLGLGGLIASSRIQLLIFRLQILAEHLSCAV